MRRIAFPPTRAYYVPVDEIAASPRARILRAIRHFDWVSSRDLFDALDLPSWKEEGDRLRYFAMLNLLVKRGLVEQRGDRETREYRLAADVDVSIPAPTLDAYVDACSKRRAS